MKQQEENKVEPNDVLEAGMADVSTFPGQKLTARIHSAIFKALGVEDFIFESFDGGLEVIPDPVVEGSIIVPTGLAAVGSRVISVKTESNFFINPGFYFKVVLDLDLSVGKATVALLQDATKEPDLQFQDDLQANPNGRRQFAIAFGRRQENIEINLTPNRQPDWVSALQGNLDELVKELHENYYSKKEYEELRQTFDFSDNLKVVGDRIKLGYPADLSKAKMMTGTMAATDGVILSTSIVGNNLAVPSVISLAGVYTIAGGAGTCNIELANVPETDEWQIRFLSRSFNGTNPNPPIPNNKLVKIIIDY